MIAGPGTMSIGEATTKFDASSLAIADTLVDAIIELELDHSRDIVARHGRTRYFVYPDDRADSTLAHECFSV
jgi:hypothetical protein